LVTRNVFEISNALRVTQPITYFYFENTQPTMTTMTRRKRPPPPSSAYIIHYNIKLNLQ